MDVKKEVTVALSGVKNIDKKYGVHYFYHKKLEIEKNSKNHIQKIETPFKIWRMRNSSLEESMAIFKTFSISKIINLPLVTVLPYSTITQLNKIHK